MKPSGNKGKVYLIGAGPGDPGLITLKGKECIEHADTIIYDYLAAPALLSHASPGAETIYVGKKGGDHTLSQEGINALIVEKASQGKTVARLKGGDPFIFGRGGEEVQELIEAGIPYEIVPGVTSAIAAPAYAGIPLTHRHFTSSVSIITGHEDPLKQESNIDWPLISKSTSTLVFLMGVKNLPRISEQLIRHGKAKETPVAIIQWGTTSKQKSVQGTLETIVKIAEEGKIKSPSVIVVGEVVSLKDKMKWFENRPLFGKRIVVTRAREQASDLLVRLNQLGAECIECPTIKVVPPEDPHLIKHAIEQIGSYSWIIFTSVNGVKFFFNALFELNLDVRVLGHLKTASIGPATAAALLNFGIKSDIIPESYQAESIIDAFRHHKMDGVKVLLPRAADARMILPVELRKMGAEVEEVKTYRTEIVQNSAETLLKSLEEQTVDLITFTSSSTVTNFKNLIPEKRFLDLMRGVTIACIGPVTADTARNAGLDVHIVSDTFTIPGLCEAIKNYYT